MTGGMAPDPICSGTGAIAAVTPAAQAERRSAQRRVFGGGMAERFKANDLKN